MHKIAVISDTHGLLRPEILEVLRGCEAILHGGDINQRKNVDELTQIAPLYAVRGNNDRDWAKDLPETLFFTLYGVRFFMAHNKKMIPKNIDDVDIVIYGHSHKYEENHIDGKLLLNPGSCGARRFTLPVTMAVLEITKPQESLTGKASFRVEKIEIAQHTHTVGVSLQIVQNIMRDTNRGKSVREMAVRNGISEELAEQICRLYLTHPGVDAEGIMGKMGL